MANSGESPDEIRVVLADTTKKERHTLTKRADKARLADTGLSGLNEEQNLSNLRARLDKRKDN
ncbi:MAG: hypothetical protein AAGH49_11100 [Pseudomonadota bacterium]